MPPTPFRAFASRPTWLMLGTVVSWIPVYITFTDHVGRISSVNGPSMYPFLNTDYNSSTARDYVYISMRNPGLGLERGMIVAFWSPNNPERMAVKRIVAVEGDEVRTKAPYPLTHEVVPVGHVWLEGENPDGTKSIDSNTYGPVSKSLIMGKVKAVIWPWPKAGLIRWQDYHGSPRVTENKVAVIPRPIHKG